MAAALAGGVSLRWGTCEGAGKGGSAFTSATCRAGPSRSAPITPAG